MKKQTVGNALKTIAKEVPQELAGSIHYRGLKERGPGNWPR